MCHRRKDRHGSVQTPLHRTQLATFLRDNHLLGKHSCRPRCARRHQRSFRLLSSQQASARLRHGKLPTEARTAAWRQQALSLTTVSAAPSVAPGSTTTRSVAARSVSVASRTAAAPTQSLTSSRQGYAHGLAYTALAPYQQLKDAHGRRRLSSGARVAEHASLLFACLYSARSVCQCRASICRKGGQSLCRAVLRVPRTRLCQRDRDRYIGQPCNCRTASQAVGPVGPWQASRPCH